ncbi:N-6 DNA methylase [Gordonia sp. AC31]|uniref:HsdM family class I SAM-dependent methyltransferase n=1 Tax=Gordonia sp. AC31 TaxID=2962571 RepID=UPI002882BCC6|nr:N-6 DNA methylase [Gordonia sp. AC31]MDT0223766.1 N-6 DNA methylase [Gordonia sp. AC31]
MTEPSHGAMLDVPLLGTVGELGQSELRLARQFDELHQLIYARGGVRPTNAAIEEVSKLVYMRMWTSRISDGASLNENSLSKIFSRHHSAPDDDFVDLVKQAFVFANKHQTLAAQDLDGRPRSLWPVDEPFRMSDETVIRAAINLVEDVVSDQSRSVADPLGTAFDAFLSGRYDHAGGLGTYLTPSSIARSMAEVALSFCNPVDGWDITAPVVADPYCGTGRFLVAAFEALESRLGSATLDKLLNGGLLGADQSPGSAAKAALNLFLYGATSPLVFPVADSVTESDLDRLEGTLQLILTNPPFGGGKYSDAEGIERTRNRIPSLSRAKAIDPALACTIRAFELLRPGGILGIVLPDGIVDGRHFDEFLNSSSDATVVANISLPTSSFALSGTVAKTSAVFIKRTDHVRSKRTILARVEHVGFLRQAGKAAADPSGSDLPAVVEAVGRATTLNPLSAPFFVVSDKPLVASVATEAIVSLDPSRIDPGALAARERLNASGAIKLGEFLTTRRRQLQKKSDLPRPFLSVLHVDALGVASWHDADRYTPTTPGQIANKGEVLVSLLNPSKLRATVVPDEYDRVVCSSEFGVFVPNIDPYAVLGLLYQPDVQAQLRPLGRGTSSSRRRINPSDVLNLYVPALSSGELDALSETVSNAIDQVESGRRVLYSTYGLPSVIQTSDD